MLNDIDRDGSMLGYNLSLVNSIRKHVHIPFTLIGGAGSLNDIGALIRDNDNIGAGAGSLFVFKGKFRAVLISYPSHSEKLELFNNNYKLICDK